MTTYELVLVVIFSITAVGTLINLALTKEMVVDVYGKWMLYCNILGAFINAGVALSIYMKWDKMYLFFITMLIILTFVGSFKVAKDKGLMDKYLPKWYVYVTPVIALTAYGVMTYFLLPM